MKNIGAKSLPIDLRLSWLSDENWLSSEVVVDDNGSSLSDTVGSEGSGSSAAGGFSTYSLED